MELQIVFVSNYINHHQIPFCQELHQKLGEGFCFIQTQAMDQERVQMGWNGQEKLPFVKYYEEQPQECDRWIMESRVVLFGGTDEEGYIAPRLEAGKPVFRYCERMYKTGQWKAVSPRGLKKKYHDHTRYRKAPVYLMCAGAYVPSDYHIVRAYPGKMYQWGYFPECKTYDVEKLMGGKGWSAEEEAVRERSGENGRMYLGEEDSIRSGEKRQASTCRGGESEKLPYLLWAARFIDWKHPQLPVKMAAGLKARGCRFHMDIIGGGELEEEVKGLVKALQVEDCVSLLGFRKPEEVRTYMEKADIYLVTSDRQEGWGAVVNEAMNSGCAVVANHMIGAVPYLIDPERNGKVYYDKDEAMLLDMLTELCRDKSMCRRLGEEAYRTITREWNPQVAAARFLELLDRLEILHVEGGAAGAVSTEDACSSAPAAGACSCAPAPTTGPCSPAPVIGEFAMKRLLKRRAAANRRDLQ